MVIKFFSSKYSGEPRAMYNKSNNIEVMIGSEIDEITEDLFVSFLQRYQKTLEVRN